MTKIRLWVAVSVTAVGLVVVPGFVVAQNGGSVVQSAAAPKETAHMQSAPEAQPVTISVFVRDDCAHCAAEKAFLAQLLKERGADIRVLYHNIDIPKERERFRAIAKRFGLSQGTPITLVGTTIFSGFDTAQTSGAFITKLVDTTRVSTTFDEILAGRAPEVTVASSLVNAGVCADDPSAGCDTSALTVRVPLIGTQLNLATFSLPAVSLTLGLIDGFNPCAMWVLVVFLTLLMRAGSRRRMVQFAGLFILAEAVMYWAILLVWFSAWDFIGLSRIVTPAVGLLALGSGLYFLYKFSTWKPVCSVTNAAQQNKLEKRMETIAANPLTWAAAVGVLALAFSVNVFEFACSIGIPQAYTKILEINDLTFWQTQGQMALYIAMYMIDDIVVFLLALWGIDKISDTMTYSKWTTFLGGVLMIVLGLLMLLAPETLVF